MRVRPCQAGIADLRSGWITISWILIAGILAVIKEKGPLEEDLASLVETEKRLLKN